MSEVETDDEFAEQIMRMDAQGKADARDAARYRWLRNRQIGDTLAVCEWLSHDAWFRSGRLMPNQIDETIDAAMAAATSGNSQTQAKSQPKT